MKGGAASVLLMGSAPAGCVGQFLGAVKVDRDPIPTPSAFDEPLEIWSVEERAQVEKLQGPPKGIVGKGFPIKFKAVIGSSSCNSLASSKFETIDASRTIRISATKLSRRSNQPVICTADVYSVEQRLEYFPKTPGVYAVQADPGFVADSSSFSIEVLSDSSSDVDWWVPVGTNLSSVSLPLETKKNLEVSATADVFMGSKSCNKFGSLIPTVRDDVRIVYIHATTLQKESPLPLNCGTEKRSQVVAFSFVPRVSGQYQVWGLNSTFGSVIASATINVEE